MVMYDVQIKPEAHSAKTRKFDIICGAAHNLTDKGASSGTLVNTISWRLAFNQQGWFTVLDILGGRNHRPQFPSSICISRCSICTRR